ncbi:hypothetical protein N9J95_00685 [Candidatus Pelagibacter sp.]|nr:hypothetical protein [Candidatus Pelagibacter sp.]
MNKIFVIVISALILFTTNLISAERDCTNPKGFHEKLMCKNFDSDSVDADSGSTKKKKFFKTPEILKKLNKWSEENKTIIK